MQSSTRLLTLAACLLGGPGFAQDRFPGPATPPATAPIPPAAAPIPPAAQPAPTRPAAPAPAALPGTTAQPDAKGSAELRDLGVAPTDRLRDGAMHGPTPTSIPGAQVVTTAQLVQLLKANPDGVRVFDVLGAPERLPGALNALPAHQSGNFDDAVQREFGQYLQQVTKGRPDMRLVFYCSSTMCWMSYNAALRAARLGHRHVLWYRGGLEAWKAAGQPVQSAQR